MKVQGRSSTVRARVSLVTMTRPLTKQVKPARRVCLIFRGVDGLKRERNSDIHIFGLQNYIGLMFLLKKKNMRWTLMVVVELCQVLKVNVGLWAVHTPTD